MKQKLFWLDLACCLLWVIAFIGSRELTIQSFVITLFAIITRVSFSFFLYYQEKKSWIPLVLFGVSSFSGSLLSGVYELRIYPFIVLGLEFNRTAFICWTQIINALIWFIPTGIYLYALWRKNLVNNNFSWKQGLGAILWHDQKAKTYFNLLMIAASATLIGRAMSPRLCFFACMALPILSLSSVLQYYRIYCKKIWLMLISMILFVIAQQFGGSWRILILAVSLLLAGYLCFICFYHNKRMITLSIISLIYHGVILPSLTIGYNQYTCLRYERFQPLESYLGVFMIKDPDTQKVGLRDRYRLLVSPEYDMVSFHDEKRLWGTLELWKNGYCNLYNICDNRMEIQEDTIDHSLQDKICNLVDNHFEYYNYENNERIELKVTDYNESKMISHVKYVQIGASAYNDYEVTTFTTEDKTEILPGEFQTDKHVTDGYIDRNVLRYSYDIMNDSVPLFNIEIKTSRKRLSQKGELIALSEMIEEIIKE